MIKTIQQLKKNHQNFDVIWNKIGTEVQTDLVKTAPELLTALGAWYNRSNELIFELEEQIEESALTDTAKEAIQDLDEEEEVYGGYVQEIWEEEEYGFDEDEDEEEEEEEDTGDMPRPGVTVNI